MSSSSKNISKLNRLIYIGQRLKYLNNILKKLGTTKHIGKFRVR